MKGHVRERGKDRHQLFWDGPKELGPDGTVRRRQKTMTFYGTPEEAQDKMREILREIDRGEFVAPSKQTFGEVLQVYIEKIVKPSKRAQTYRTQKSFIENHIRPALGAIAVQSLRPSDLLKYYAERSHLSPSTLRGHHATIRSALNAAVVDQVVKRNVAIGLKGLRAIEYSADDMRANTWTADEAAQFMAVAKDGSAQTAAFYALALDSGMRLAELCGLKWDDVNFNSGTVAVVRQLASFRLADDGSVQFGPPKTRRSTRTIQVSDGTADLLRAHKRAQAELKLRNRTTYADHGLVFANEIDRLGVPLRKNRGEFERLVASANVRRITFHGLRHTSATLLLAAGEPAKTVSERLGHSSVAFTLDRYVAVLPTMQKQAADRIGALLHGGARG